MEAVVFSSDNYRSLYASTLYDVGKYLSLLSQNKHLGYSNTASVRNEFYESINILALSSIPCCTCSLLEDTDCIELVQKQGAIIGLLKLLLGKKAKTQRDFTSGCLNTGGYIVSTYLPDAPKDAITKKDICALVKEFDSRTSFVSMLVSHAARIKIILLPAQAREEYTGAVYLHNNESTTNGYTIVIPAGIHGVSKNDVLALLWAELSACLADMYVRDGMIQEYKNSAPSAGTVPVLIFGMLNSPEGITHIQNVQAVYRYVAQILPFTVKAT